MLKSTLRDIMTQLEDDIRTLREKYERNVQIVKKASPISAKENLNMELLDYSKEFKKTSDEYKYIIKLIKAFSEMEYNEIKEFVESNYDNYERINSIIKTFDDNFEDKEIRRYESRYVVLQKCLLTIIQEGI